MVVKLGKLTSVPLVSSIRSSDYLTDTVTIRQSVCMLMTDPGLGEKNREAKKNKKNNTSHPPKLVTHPSACPAHGPLSPILTTHLTGMIRVSVFDFQHLSTKLGNEANEHWPKNVPTMRVRVDGNIFPA